MYRRKNQDQEWPAWSPGQWPKKRKSGKGGGKDGGKKAAESAPVVRAYDSDGSSTMSSRSSAAGSTQLDAGVQDFFKEFMGGGQIYRTADPREVEIYDAS